MWRARRALDGLDDDICEHIERETQDNVDRGMSRDDARRQAMMTFGNVALITEDTRAVWGWPTLDGIRQDLRYAWRALRKNPAFAIVVALTLGFGTGINTATFSIVNAALIRPLGYADPERLVALHEHLAGFGLEGDPFSAPDFLDFQRDQQSFDGLAAYVNQLVELSEGGEPIRADAAKVSANLFSVLGVTALLGRDFTVEDDRPGTDVAVLAWGLWQTRYSRDPAIIGKTITLDRRPYTVIGVMPATFEFPLRGARSNSRPASVWVPMAFTGPQKQGRGDQFLYSVIGRLKKGVSIDDARTELEVLGSRINASYPPVLRNANFSIRLSATPLRESIAGRVERPLFLLLAAVGLVLLVTCANVANLLLARASSRAREIAVRTALGSSRGRLAQLMFAEAAILSTAGALVGVVFSRLVVGAVPAVVRETLPLAGAISIDVRVLAFTAGVVVVSSFFFALLPLVTVDRVRPGAALQEGPSRSTPGSRRHRLQAALVVTTVVLAVVLLVGAGLFIRSFAALMAIDAGFNPDQVLTAAVTLPKAGYSSAASVRTFHRALLTRASSWPGVRSAALVTDLPLENYERRTLSAEGAAAARAGPLNTNLSWVYGPYFQTLGIRLKSGRRFTELEWVEPRHVVIINERLAQTLWPGENALGKRLHWGLDVPQNPNPWLTVVGIVEDVANGPLGVEPFRHAYEPFSQFPDLWLDRIATTFGRHIKVAVRTDGDPRALTSVARATIRDIDSQLAIESIATMATRMSDTVATRRFGAATLSAFAMGALVLAAIGLYGLLAFTIRERRREIAVRLALGAQASEIRRMLVGHGLKLVAIGLVLGVGISYGVGRTISSLLYQTKSHDIVTFGTVPVVLLLVAVIACALPAYRASRVEPMGVLRTE
jgi:putative ABC transport system permease protein